MTRNPARPPEHLVPVRSCNDTSIKEQFATTDGVFS